MTKKENRDSSQQEMKKAIKRPFTKHFIIIAILCVILFGLLGYISLQQGTMSGFFGLSSPITDTHTSYTTGCPLPEQKPQS